MVKKKKKKEKEKMILGRRKLGEGKEKQKHKNNSEIPSISNFSFSYTGVLVVNEVGTVGFLADMSCAPRCCRLESALSWAPFTM